MGQQALTTEPPPGGQSRQWHTAVWLLPWPNPWKTPHAQTYLHAAGAITGLNISDDRRRSREWRS